MMLTSRPTRCPNPGCLPAVAGQASQLVRHSFLRTGTGRRQRWRCKNCRRTFTARTGTAYHGLRSSAARFDGVVRMSVEGTSKAAIARVERVSSSTVDRWIERAAAHTRAFQERVMREVEPVELQADEARGIGPSRDDRHFLFCVVEVWSRLWLSQRVGARTLRNCRLVMHEARVRCALGQPRVLIVTDPFRYYRVAIKRTWGPTCVHVESGKIIRGGRVIRVRNQLVHGTEWQLEAARARSEDSKKLNTAYIERLNLFARRSLAYLHRRTTSLAQSAHKLAASVDVLQCYYNFVRPHGSLKFGKEVRTPAQQAGLVTRRLSFRDIFMSFRPWARVPWIADPKLRAEWGMP